MVTNRMWMFVVSVITLCAAERLLVEETESHVVIGFLLWLFLLLLLLFLSSGGSTTGSWGSSGGGSSACAGTNVGDELLDVAAGQSLGEQTGPEGLDGDLGGLQDRVDLLTSDVDVVIGEDEGGVDAGKFGSVVHCVC